MRWLVVAAVVVVAAGACGKKRQRRSSDAAPVEVIPGPNLGSGAKPSEEDEREPNDGADVATSLPLGGTGRGRIEPDSDVDYYRIQVEQGGGLSVQVSAIAGVDLTVEIEDAGGTVIAKSDRGGASVVEGVPNLGVTPGRYTAVVRKKAAPPAKGKKPPPKPKKGKAAAPDAGSGSAGSAATAGPAPVYTITAQVAPFAKNAEHEPDDDRGTANDLVLGETATGFIGWTGDADVWKLSIEALAANNVLDLEIGPVENVAFSVEIADGIGQPLLVRKAPKGAVLAVRGIAPVAPAGAPPYHYVTIKADRSNPQTPYPLKAGGRVPGNDAETEPNDAPDKAMEIPADRTVVSQASWSPGDVDCFAVAPDPAARTLEIAVEVPADADLRLELFAGGKSIATADTKKKGAREVVSGAVAANERAVVCVRGTDASREGTYDLAVSEPPGKP